MPDRFRINLTAEALGDIERMRDFIAMHSPDNAAAFVAKLLDQIDKLDLMSSRLRRVGQTREDHLPVHALVFHPYLIYYAVNAGQQRVTVLTIRHGARRQPRRFG